MNSEETIASELRGVSTTRQRLRIAFARDATLKYIGHLDMARTWQRILRRADLPLAYTEGFNPQPKITFAAALPVGCTSEHEVMDIVLSPACNVADMGVRLRHALPPGIHLTSIDEVDLRAPALQMQLAATEYALTLEEPNAMDELNNRVQQFLAAGEVMRNRRGKTYNLRPLVLALSIERHKADRAIIRTRLQATPDANGRPDELALALGLDLAVVKIHRTKLVFLDKTN